MKNRREHYCPESGCKAKTVQYRDIQYIEAKNDYVDVWVCGNCRAVVPKRVTQPRASRIDGYQTPSQKKAVARIKNFLEEGLNSNPKYGDQITKFEITVNDYDGSLWLRAETEMMGLGENNLLRFLEHRYWNFLVKRGGKVEAHQYPESFEQFKGKKVHYFIHVK